MLLKREKRINLRKTYRHGERRYKTGGEGAAKGITHLLLQEGKRNMYCNEGSQAERHVLLVKEGWKQGKSLGSDGGSLLAVQCRQYTAGSTLLTVGSDGGSLLAVNC